MLGPKGQVQVFGYPRPCDMRKSFNTLSGLVLEMGLDLTCGDAFVFVARNRKRAKVLWFDGTGLNLLTKRIEEGIFACLWDTSANSIKLTMNELALLLEGCAMVGRIPLSPKTVHLEEVNRVAQVQFQ